MLNKAAFLGIDVGTSGIRAIVIDRQQNVLASIQQAMLVTEEQPPQDYQQQPDIWWHTLQSLLSNLSRQFDFKQIRTLSLDATSGTVLLIRPNGKPLTNGLMYNDQRAIDFAEKIKHFAPTDSPACSTSSGLAKVLWLLNTQRCPEQAVIAHQADWLNGQLSGQYQHTDSNNALKTGYDPVKKIWPDWMAQLGINKNQLPEVHPPGTLLCPLDKNIIQQFGFNPQAQLVSGTTDSTAALLATGANNIGDAVTSLGSTLVLKIISDKYITSSEYGVYSQPFGKYWLVGGASNSGGAVLRHFFSDQQMQQLEQQLHPDQPTTLQYYPLLQTGERFPTNNPELAPCLTPRPDSDAEFFQAILEGISNIEQLGYKKLQQLGAPAAKRLFSIGGGTVNKSWQRIRKQKLKIPMQQALNNHPAFGAALLAQQGYDTPV